MVGCDYSQEKVQVPFPDSSRLVVAKQETGPQCLGGSLCLLFLLGRHHCHIPIKSLATGTITLNLSI